jgi:hypothetical protein
MKTMHDKHFRLPEIESYKQSFCKLNVRFKSFQKLLRIKMNKENGNHRKRTLQESKYQRLFLYIMQFHFDNVFFLNHRQKGPRGHDNSSIYVIVINHRMGLLFCVV